MYINDTNNAEIKSYSQIKADNPNTSLPSQPQPVVLSIWFIINPTAKPAYNTDTQRIVSAAPTKSGDTYHEVWNTVTLTTQEKESNLANAIESAQNSLDSECETYIKSYWSENAQRNASLGLIDEANTALCKQEVGDVLAENTVFISDVAALTLPSEISTYVSNVSRIVITGRI